MTAHHHQPRVPADWPVRPIRANAHRLRATATDLATCGTCGRSWDDGVVTGMTPTPSARCPFEYFHPGMPRTIVTGA